MGYNLKYTPEFVNKRDNVFMEEFYTGVDTKIYINDVEIDFIAALSYSVQENVNPLYGYSSYAFDDVAVGNRLVSGNILIPIKNYDTKIIDFTNKEHNIIQDKDAYLDNKVWKDKPEWAKNIDTLITKSGEDKQKKVDDDNVKIVRTKKDVEGDKSEEEVNRYTDDKRELKKWNLKRIDSPHFNEVYSNKEATIRMIRARLMDSYRDIDIRLSGRSYVRLKTVVFRSSSKTFSSNDEALYESLEFIARDIEYLDEIEIETSNKEPDFGDGPIYNI